MSNELIEILSLWYLPFLRAWGMVIMLPLSEAGIGLWRKSLLALGLSLLGYGHAQEGGGAALSLYALREVLIGALVSLPCACIVTLAGMWGDLFDTARGQNISTLYDPLHETQEPVMAVLVKQLCWVQILCCGLLEQLVVQYQKSFVILGVGANMAATELGGQIVTLLARGTTQMLQLFLPFAALFLLVEIGVGFIGRALPSLSLSSEGLQLKSYLGFALLLLVYQAGAFGWLFEISSRPLSLLQLGAG